MDVVVLGRSLERGEEEERMRMRIRREEENKVTEIIARIDHGCYGEGAQKAKQCPLYTHMQ